MISKRMPIPKAKRMNRQETSKLSSLPASAGKFNLRRRKKAEDVNSPPLWKSEVQQRCQLGSLNYVANRKLPSHNKNYGS
jgi:hypothetical protein